MAQESTLVRNVRDGLAEVKEQVGEALHKVWPFQTKEQREKGVRDTVPFPAAIYETDDAFIVVGELAGVERGGVHVQVTENELTITGRFEETLDGEEEVSYSEVPGADYRRTFTLSDAVNREQISAELKDGVLTLRLSKSDSLKPRMIPITA
jgi:HSP20 family molecular chaperone IbpA